MLRGGTAHTCGYSPKSSECDRGFPIMGSLNMGSMTHSWKGVPSAMAKGLFRAWGLLQAAGAAVVIGRYWGSQHCRSLT